MGGPRPPRSITRARVAIGRRRRFADRHELIDRSAGHPTLVLLLAGHKDWLWPTTLARVAQALPPGVDVCVVSPGRRNDDLAEFAAARGWSHLSTRRGHVSVAQNIAIRAHPAAERIFKVDEDIFVPPTFFRSLAQGFERVRAESQYEIGFCAPLLNVNTDSYADVLEALDLEVDWEARFGPITRSPLGTPAHEDGDAAVYLWECTMPVDRTSEIFAQAPNRWSVVPMRYSIGAILFERSLWQAMGGFALEQDPPGLGDDEEQLCNFCFRSARVIAVVHSVFAGHFSYGPQTARMREAFEGEVAAL